MSLICSTSGVSPKRWQPSQSSRVSTTPSLFTSNSSKSAASFLVRLAAFTRAQELVHVTLAADAGPDSAAPVNPEAVRHVAADFEAVEDSEFIGRAEGSFFGFQLPSHHQDAFIEAMLEKGFSRASVAKLDLVYEKRNPLYEKLVGALD